MVRPLIGADEAQRVARAVSAAEAHSDGEIVTVIAPRSDAYNDVIWHWSILVMFLALATYASFPDFYRELLVRLLGWAAPDTPRALLFALFVALAAKLLGTRLILGLGDLRYWLTPPETRVRRVRRRAIEIFRVAVETRTRGRTGVLLYLSIAERRAEIVADAAIHGRVDADEWGEAMAVLLAAVRDGRPADGMIAAVERIGAVLARHFPRSADDADELPDRLILL